MNIMPDYEKIIADLYDEVAAMAPKGTVAAYIPELAAMNPQHFAVTMTTVEGQVFQKGSFEEKYSIQSIAKVLSLSLAYSMLGEAIWTRVGVEPSGTAFNSLLQLEADSGIPRNPFINAGAIVVSDILISNLANPKEEFLAFVNAIAGRTDIRYSAKIAASEKSVGYRNIALCNFLKSFGNIHNEADAVLNFYFDLCSIEMNCTQLSAIFLFLANAGVSPLTGKKIISATQTKRINALMQTCGFYDESGEFAFKVGLPGKSGVGGGIIAIHPQQYSIAVWSPRLNSKGNSYKGMVFLEEFTTRSALSIF